MATTANRRRQPQTLQTGTFAAVERRHKGAAARSVALHKRFDGQPRRAAATPVQNSESKMPRYHFDLVNTRTVADQGGAELCDDIEAMDSADQIARRILDEHPDLRDRHYSIVVTNEDGDEICRLPFEILH